ncbi:MAG: esterase family protein [Armatimonadetes bacterium]|nr:esterase family protein [Armatimonadota bacterium]
MDCSPKLPYGGNTWWYGYANGYPNAGSGIVFNYTENMLLNMLQWAKSAFPIDPDRVSVAGGSMGATGALSFGLRHPDLFAAISATVPQVNPGLEGIGWSQSQLTHIWGSVQDNLPTNDGAGVWDRQNTTAYVADNCCDLPFIKVQNSKNDETLPWFQVPQFYKNLNANRHGFMAAWGQGGHVSSSTGLPSEFVNWDIYNKHRRNQSYPAISNSSVNDDPGNGDPINGDSIGQMNAGYDWRIISDTEDKWAADIKYTVAGRSPTADVSARRLQNFSFAAGQRLAYSLTDTATGQAITSGYVTAERNRFFTVADLPFDNNYRTLTIRKVSGQSIADVIALPEGSEVDVDEVIVTATFEDVCYGCASNRIPAIAILGASDLAPGNVIRLRGVKKTHCGVAAVDISAGSISVHGNCALRPFGLTRPFFGVGKPLELGLLTKVWGVVRDILPGGFELDAGLRVTVFGDCAADAEIGSYVSVSGICSELPSGSDYGIRMSDPTGVIYYQGSPNP